MLLSEGRQIKTIYQPSQKKSMHVVVFGSGSGTNLEALLRAQRELQSSTGHPLFEIKALFTDRQCRYHEIAERERIPLIHHSYVSFSKNCNNIPDNEIKIAYDTKNVSLIEKCAREHNFSVDLIFLAGYMRLLTSPLLCNFADKILNVHPADLTSINDFGKRKYVGANAVFNALMNGETRTRSSVILINENMDAGPILVSGPWTTYTEGFPVTFKRAAYHQDKQKTYSDWKASIKAAELIAEGRLAIDENQQVYVDGKPTDKGGYILNP